MDLVAANSRSKAAAWAWYQRTSGSVAAPRSEVALAAPHRSVRSGPSRFKLESELLLPGAPIQDTSDRLESLHLSMGSSNSSSDGAIEPSGLLTALSTAPIQQINGHPHVCTDLVLAASNSYGAAAWDCGSALFDSFELVAMSKKLDYAHQLNHATIEKVCPRPAEGASADTPLATHTAALSHDSLSSLVGIKDLQRLSKVSDTNQLPPDQMQSRQAIYDMFCRYDNPVPHVFCEDVNQCNREHMRKSKPTMSPVTRSKQYRRRQLHSLSKVFKKHIAQFASHSRASSTAHRPPDKLCLTQSLSLPTEATAQLQHQSHSLPVESTTHLHRYSQKTAHAASPQLAGIKSMGSPVRECPPSESCGIRAPNYTLGKQHSSDSVHHHYHHHYHHHHHHHYLFRRHSDEGFTTLPEPLLGADKSLLVAAAGLRTAKVSSLQDYLSLNPKLEGAFLDYKRKLKDVNMSTTTPIQSPIPPSLHV